MIKIAQIRRYPVKGLSAESLEQVQLQPGQGVPHDRRFALAHASAKFDLLKPEWLPKTYFLMLKRDQRLATLETSFDEESGVLSVYRNGEQMARGDLTAPEGRAEIEDFFADYMKREAKGGPRLLEAPPDHMFSDHRNRVLSLINPASIAELEKVIGAEKVVAAPINPIRFRPNLILDGAAAWAEFQWLDREISIGGARLKVTKRIDRCAATHVDPDTGNRDMNILKALKQGFGHVDMGVYAKVLRGGAVAVGDELKVL